MFRAYIDESGNDAREPMLVTAAFVGRVEDWERFADEWQLALEDHNPKPLVLHKGHRYFKHSEARGSEGCFAGFSVYEAEEKTINLASIIARYDFSALALTLERESYFRIVDEVAVRKSGRLYKDYVRDPLYIALHRLVDVVLHTQNEINPNDNVDFIFDEGAMSDRVISIFKFVRDLSPDFISPIMGTLISMNDKKMMPLQAVDLFAGQLRMALQTSGRIFMPLVELKEMPKYWVQPIDEWAVRTFLSMANTYISTRRLVAIKDKK